MKKLKLFSLLMLMFVLFSCADAEQSTPPPENTDGTGEEVVTPELFNVNADPEIGDYTNLVGIRTSADFLTLFVDYTGFNVDNEVTRFGNVSIDARFLHPVSKEMSYSDWLYYEPSQNTMKYQFNANGQMITIPQCYSHIDVPSDSDVLKFDSPITWGSETPSALQIGGGIKAKMKYTPDLLYPNNYTEYYFEGNDDAVDGYGVLTLVGMSGYKNGTWFSEGDTNG